MKTIFLFRLFVVALACLLIGGCKIQIEVPKGGSVIAESGRYECLSGQVCTIDVDDVYFDERFVALPEEGYRFLGWKKRAKGFCGGANQPCRLTTVLFPAFDSFMAILKSNDVFYLEPVFGCDDDRDCYDIRVNGDPEVVFDWSADRCEMEDIPDAPARAFRDAAGNIQLIASHFISRRMIGSSLDTLVRECNVIMDSNYDPDPGKYDDKQWIVAPYTTDGITIHALLHNEYQGHTHPGMCPSGSYFSCWYNSITYARSEDMGNSYTHAKAPDHLVASVPYPYVPDEGPYGIFEGSNIIHNEADGFYYRLLHLETRGAQELGVGVMRTKSLEDPASWRCWDGKGFNASFVNPYKDTAFDPAEHVCAPVSRDNINKMADSLTYNKLLGKYLLVGVDAGFDQDRNWTSGIFYSLSDDLINWSPRELIMKSNKWDGTVYSGDVHSYASIIDSDDQSRNFENSDQDMHLYLTRWQGGDAYDRDLIRIPIEITVNPTDATPPEGFLDLVDCAQITGWSWDAGEPNLPLRVAIYDVTTHGTERLVTTVTANIYRPDLKAALGDNGVHGFSITTPPALRDGLPHIVRAYGINPDPDFPNGTLIPAGVPLECH